MTVLLVEGTLEVIRHSEAGKEIVVREILPGEIVGEMACLDGEPHSATIRAATKCRIISMQSEKFRDRVKEDPSLFQIVLEQQIARLRGLTQKVEKLSFEPVSKRVADELLREAGRRKTDELNLTHQQLADRIAATRESVTKALKPLVDHKIIRLSRGKIFILNPKALAEKGEG